MKEKERHMLATRRPSSPFIEQLRGVSLFAGCTDKELERIDRLGCPNEVEAGTVLCRQGSVGRQTFVILEGEATVTIGGADVAHLGPGSFFGEMSVLDGTPRVGTVTAKTRMALLVFTPQELAELLENARVVRRMLAAVSGRLRLAERSNGVDRTR
jgi:CRP/FNR family cyclic AMP-dependent transcriptional regulator